ncbi:MAG: GNAT family N-acetyltransferase [gamma proteobacterium endosymbiont of Lamellibrachia anaximandri]|nr:GNAT family N-acetyltransferase [gamma proteobacterium endosymbiont of Lamellibrachia anaximandri]MBL3617860.1 GNAT family N-acetyltransferase [gamma proteobacterium endosymbiont of Lamellibrachia anaximandri]
MSSESELVIEPLNRNHNRATFNCGIESLDRYLKRQASQDIKRRISRVFVACALQDETRVLGYYTLSTLSIDLSVLPEKVAKKLPRHPIPAALISRLAIDISAQGKGIGKMLLSNSIKRTLAVRDDIAISAMVVDAINQEADSFYKRYGFSRLAHSGSRLFLPLKSL